MFRISSIFLAFVCCLGKNCAFYFPLSVKVTSSNLTESRFLLGIRKKLLSVRRGNRLSREVVDTPSLEVFQAWIDGTLSNLM